jgi:hypothetical protein
MNSLDASLYKDELVIHGSTVVWSLNDGLVRKRTFDFENDKQPVTQALFTLFSSPSSNASTSASIVSTLEKPVDLSPSQSSHDSPNKALVVVLKTLMHIIYLDGGSYIVHLPFPILKVWAIPLGLLLERQVEPSQTSTPSHSETQLPRLFTLSSPLDEFGVVSCNRSSLDPDEEIVFVSPRNDALWVTRNIPENRITLWHASPDHQARRKVPFIISIKLTSSRNLQSDDAPQWVRQRIINPRMMTTTMIKPFRNLRCMSRNQVNQWNAITHDSPTSASPWTGHRSLTPIGSPFSWANPKALNTN